MELMSYKTPGLTVFFQWISLLVEDSFMMTFLAIGYWCFDKKFYRDLAIVVLISTLLNGLLKVVFKVPRPVVEHLVVVSDSYSFPSGHAQITAVFWLMLALHYRKTYLWWLAGLIIVSQCLSRVYLGVHFPRDVFIGTVIGMTTALYYGLYRDSFYWSLFSRSKWAMALIFTGFIGVYWFCMIDDLNANMIVAMGALIGVIIGYLLENHFCSYQNPESYLTKVIYAVIGMAMLLTVEIMFKSFLPVQQSLIYLLGMYLTLGIQITFIFPVMVKLCLLMKNKWQKVVLRNG